MRIDENIGKLTKNPLGIIALFILLTYGITSIVFGIVNNNITEYQKWAFVVFIILFPIIVLITFYRLVTKYHTHLYSPGEYRNEEYFLGITDKKLEKEIEVMEMVEVEKINNSEKINKNEDKIIMNQYEKAEKLVLEKIAKDRNLSIRKDLNFKYNDSGFDGILEDKKIITYVEVKYLRKKFIPIAVLENINFRANNIIYSTFKILGKNKNINFLLVFVIDTNDSNLNEINELKKKTNEYLKLLNNNYLEVLIYRMEDIE